jgi:hypothetical protein
MIRFFLSILYNVCYRVSDWELHVLFFSPAEAETKYSLNVVQVHQYNPRAITRTSNDYLIESRTFMLPSFHILHICDSPRLIQPLVRQRRMVLKMNTS